MSNYSELSQNSRPGHLLSDFPRKDYDNPAYKDEEADYEDIDLSKARKRLRPGPSSYDDLTGLSTVSEGHDHLKYAYDLDSSHGSSDYPKKYKEAYALNDGSSSLYKDGYKYYKDYKDKIETDTRLTSSSDVLSNFNYETIDNYEAGDNYDTIDNYTSDEYSTSLNENSSEFAVKESEPPFGVDSSRFNRSTSSTSPYDRSSTTFEGSSTFSGASGFGGDQFARELSREEALGESNHEFAVEEPDDRKASDSGALLDPSGFLDSKSPDSANLESDFDTSKLGDAEPEAGKSQEPEKKSAEPDNVYVISEELRQSYIRQSKLLPKIRGVWFNSTVRRMGWVGQAYKKCKRIEKIFSINKHGFEGARKLAIAFRNSQKPTNKAELHYPDVSLKDVIKPISQLRINLPRPAPAYGSAGAKAVSSSYSAPGASRAPSSQNSSSLALANEADELGSSLGQPAPSLAPEFAKSLPNDPRRYRDGLEKLEPADRYAYSVDRSSQSSGRNFDRQELSDSEINLRSIYGGDEADVDDFLYPVDYRQIIDTYSSHLNREEASVRDSTCREALLFMLYELSALLELDFPIPPLPKGECKRGLSFHINFLENSKRSQELLPYINSLAHYICRGITPSDMPHYQLYSLIQTLSHCEPLKLGLLSQ